MKTCTTFGFLASWPIRILAILVAFVLSFGLQAQTKFVPGNSGGGASSASDNVIKGVRIFPNPVKDVLNISLVSPQDGSVEIYDRKMTLRKQTKINQYEKLVSIDMADLEGGTYYIVRILQGHKMYTAQVRKL